MKPLAAITGATGFLGRHVMKCFIDRGWRVRLLVRQDPQFNYACDEPIALVQGTLSNEKALTTLVEDSDVVIHMAGLIKAARSSDFEETNVNGTARLIKAIQAQSTQPKLVFVSTLAAREPKLSPYAASKANAERIIRNNLEKTVVLRPCAIYGPGDKETLVLFKSARWPFQPMLNDKNARICMVHVSDVADSIVTTAARLLDGDIPSNAYEITDERTDGYSWHELIEAACCVSGGRVRPLTIPHPVTKALGFLGDLQATLSGSAKMLTSHKVREVLHKDWSSSEETQLPHHIWRPRIPLQEGFENTLLWYRDHRWLA